ncbi:MAG: phenylacetate-CoA oxygenase subunit PaaC [Gemmatimonadaceae bacterium]|nr:phenylacetate-CoA oxygenase subunit PaaC [Gemmatimonadaceae bacterium]
MAEERATSTDTLLEYCLRLGDDRLILGHRLSEWCGHGPILEEDIALANIALDFLGQASHALEVAAAAEGAGRSADDLAFFREGVQFRNLLIVELPRGDFAFTIARQFLFDAFSVHLMDALQKSAEPRIAELAAKAVKEDRYHVRHSAEWMVKLGDGTDESHTRLQNAVNDLWRFTGEMFLADPVDDAAAAAGIAPAASTLKEKWDAVVNDVFARANITRPADEVFMRGGRTGKHTEHLGHLLAEMQIVARSHPGAEW